MERNHVILVVLGLAVCAALFFIVDIYASLIALVLVLVLAMSLFIMKDSAMFPDIRVSIREDGRGITVRNSGNAKAVDIRLSILPQDLRYTLPSLGEDEKTDFSTDMVIDKVKVLAQYQNETGTGYQKTFTLSVLDPPEEDLLKPAFPLFKWK